METQVQKKVARQIKKRAIKKVLQQLKKNKLSEVQKAKDHQEVPVIVKQKTNTNPNPIAPINFEKISEMEESEWCYDIIINKQSDLVFVSQEKGIKQFQLKNGKLNFQEMLTLKPSIAQRVLAFYNDDTCFISGSKLGNLFLWTQNDGGKWICQNTLLDGHTDFITFFTFNQKENQLFSGSTDKTIKIWEKETQWKCICTIAMDESPLSLSLNESENIFVVYTIDILVFQLIEQSWQKTQKVKLDEMGYGNIFISDEIFAFQPVDQYLQIYKLNQKNRLFEKYKEVEVSNSGAIHGQIYPMKYNQEKQLLFDVFGDCVTFIRYNQQQEFEIEQEIDFDDAQLVAALSPDCKTLITWSYYTESFEIRQTK